MTNEASQRFLLDANVVIAVIDQQHEHHTAAVDWFEMLDDQVAITCPTVENACLRYLIRTGVSATDAHAVLTGLKADRRVTFAPETSSMSTALLVPSRRRGRRIACNLRWRAPPDATSPYPPRSDRARIVIRRRNGRAAFEPEIVEDRGDPGDS